jgi:hypothetical protein
LTTGGCAMNVYCVTALDRGCHEKLLHIRAESLEAAEREAMALGMVRVVSWSYAGQVEQNSHGQWVPGGAQGLLDDLRAAIALVE